MLGNLSSPEVSMIVDKRFGSSPMPHLRDPAVRERSIRIASDQGLFDRIETELVAAQRPPLAAGAEWSWGFTPIPVSPIPVINHSLFRRSRRAGIAPGAS